MRIAPDHALNLAVFRVSVPAITLLSPEVRSAGRFASLAPGIRAAPEGLQWVAPMLERSSNAATVVQVVAVASALAAIVGVRARIALVLLTVAGFYLFAMSQLVGIVSHNMHLLWFTALLAASPCDDALAWDARARGATWLALDRAPSHAYAVPLAGARLLLGAIYFFPGLWKLREAGLAWATSDNLRNQMWWKWFQNDWVPPVRIDHAPWLLHVAAFAVIAFELSFGVLATFRRTRVLAAVAGLSFHLLSDALMRIPFLSLWACYTVLFDCHRFAGGTRKDPADATVDRTRPAAVVTALCLIGAVVQGVRGQTQAFPFACYPTFQWMVGTTMPDLQISAIRADGSTVDVRHARDGDGKRSQRQWALVWSLAGVGGDVSESRLRAYWAELQRDDAVREATKGAVAIRFFRAYVSVVPEDRRAPPVRREQIAEIQLAQ